MPDLHVLLPKQSYPAPASEDELMRTAILRRTTAPWFALLNGLVSVLLTVRGLHRGLGAASGERGREPHNGRFAEDRAGQR